MPKLWLLAFMLPTLAQAQPLRVTEATTYPARLGGNVAVALVLENPTSQTLQLIGAQTPVAARATLRQYGMIEGVTQIITPPAIELGPRSRTRLLPQATEVFVQGLTQPLIAGNEFPLVLLLQPSQTVTARVRVLPALQP